MSVIGAATPRLHVVVGVVGVVSMLAILRLVRRRQLRAKYALLWLLVGVSFVVLGLSPGLLDWAAKQAGVAYAPDLLFLVGTLFLVLVVMHLSWELSRLEDRTKVLAEELGLLRAEVQEALGDPERTTPEAVGDDPSSRMGSHPRRSLR
jgi:hypothetical protein